MCVPRSPPLSSPVHTTAATLGVLGPSLFHYPLLRSLLASIARDQDEHLAGGFGRRQHPETLHARHPRQDALQGLEERLWTKEGVHAEQTTVDGM